MPTLEEKSEAEGMTSMEGSHHVFWQFDDSTIIVPNFEREGVIYVISDNKDKARNARDEIISRIREVESKFNGLGIDRIKISSEQDFAREMLSQNNKVESIKEDEEMNDFEGEIHDEVKPISEAFGKNLTINFEGAPQNREYDLLFCLSPTNVLHISVKDYSGRDDNPVKEDLITDPRSKATLLGSNMSISAVKGANKEDMNQFKAEASLRDDIKIFKKDNIRSQTLDYIEEEMLYLEMRTFGRTLSRNIK